jgi:WD40 repeat protein
MAPDPSGRAVREPAGNWVGRTMEQQGGIPPSADELRAYSLGRCPPQRAAEIEAFLSDGPDQASILQTADDALLGHLRGAGELPCPDGPDRPSVTLPRPATQGDRDEDAAALLDHPRYRLLRKLGQGGMGTVYLAEHRLMRRLVALKFIRAAHLPQPQVVARFRQEVQAAASLSSPHVVSAYDAEEAAGGLFLVMEYVEGTSLDRWLLQHGPLPVPEACDYVRQAALGLQAAFDKGLVHRDVKPANLMRTPDGTVKVLDFGLARLVREAGAPEGSLTAAGTVMGTADYIAPEQARDSRSADVRADVYSLGCTLYHLLAGRVPFPGGTAIDKIVRHAGGAPEPISRCRPDLPAELARVVEKMMARKPEERYQAPAEVAAALEHFTTAAAPRRTTAAVRRSVGLACVLLVLGALVLAVFRWPPSRGNTTRQAAEQSQPEPARSDFHRLLSWSDRGTAQPRVSPDGKYVLAVTPGPVHAARVWERETGREVLTLDGQPGCHSPVFTPDNEVLALHGNRAYRLWDLRTGQPRKLTQLDHDRLARSSNSLVLPWAVSPSGEYLALEWSATPKSCGYVMVELHSGKETLRVVPLADDAVVISSGLFSADGKRFVTVDVQPGQSTFRAWDPATGRLVASLRVPVRVMGRMGLRDNGRLVGSEQQTGDGKLVFELWDFATGVPVHRVELAALGDYTRSLVSPDGHWLAMIYERRELARIFDLATGKEVFTCDEVPFVNWATFSADGRHVALAGHGGVHLFRLADLPREKAP